MVFLCLPMLAYAIFPPTNIHLTLYVFYKNQKYYKNQKAPHIPELWSIEMPGIKISSNEGIKYTESTDTLDGHKNMINLFSIKF